ncbi:DUF1614 domain-containing protein [bacterium]|nr:DUF1614 domain-containing protein [bacterium]
MFFLPISLLVFILFLLFLPIIFLAWFFQIVSFSFQKLGLTSQTVFLILFLTLLGSSINIPLGRLKTRYIRKENFFGFSFTQKEVEGIAINLGGAVIPIIISTYLFLQVENVFPILITLVLMVIVSKMFSRVIPGVGVGIPALVPPLFAALFSLIFYPQNPAICAYISGTLGTLIGADILNLHRIKRFPGVVSIGGAGVFDGIFLAGVIAVFLTAI